MVDFGIGERVSGAQRESTLSRLPDNLLQGDINLVFSIYSFCFVEFNAHLRIVIHCKKCICYMK
jgi:hypothetical protein